MSEVFSLDAEAIWRKLVRKPGTDAAAVRDVFAKAKELRGLSVDDVLVLATIDDPELRDELFALARWVKEEIYGKRLVIFAPLYVSNLCRNECTYCAFRARNKQVVRRVLSASEIAAETQALLRDGHKRVLLVAGESYPSKGFSYVLEAVEAVYAARWNGDGIRRVNVNVAPLSVEEFRALKATGIGTYQLFQETYDPAVYAKVHVAGPKADYQYRLTTMDRAMEAGIDDVGIGVLFGLADWRFEVLALMAHADHLERRFGAGPHTISVPRLEPATGSEVASDPPFPVDDATFQKIVAILRLAVPYTGIILSTRETPHLRRETFALGISQISAGSRTTPGGYAEGEPDASAQFSLGDHRSLDEVIADVASHGYVPSFCTGCYRLGRTGADFMDLAKPGAIKTHCTPNALTSFKEYLLDYASETTRTVGEACIAAQLEAMEPAARARAQKMLAKVAGGKRDVYC